MKTTIAKWPIFTLILITFWLKLANLGYSDYQGDEIKALPALGEGLLSFLLQQSKGPTEFIVAYLVRIANPTFSNQFLARLPYALAGILAVFFFYRMVRLHFGEQIALFSGLFFSINGLFVGLTRIVQYQSFVLLFSCLTLYAFSLAACDSRWKSRGIYTGMFFWALALLTHYDGIFIAPFALYLLYRWYKKYPDLPAAARLWQLAIPAAACGLLLAIFYLPLFASSSDSTQAYWWKRISGDVDQALIPSSIATFSLYNPLQTIFIYAGLALLSFRWARNTLPVWAWVAFPWIILEAVVHDPGTHIYTYLLPGTILAAFGLRTLGEVVTRVIRKPYGGRINLVLGVGLFGFLFAVSHLIFVDHTPEYPWEAKNVFYWKVEKPSREYKLWVFGFPYHRHWEEIGEFVTSSRYSGYYSTNEKQTIAGRFVPGRYNSDKAGFYIHVYNPQSFTDVLNGNEKVIYWTNHHPPVRIFTNGQKIVAEVFLMPPGSVDKIRAAGY